MFRSEVPMKLLPLVAALGVPVLMASLFLWAALRIGFRCPRCGGPSDPDGLCDNCTPGA